MFNESAEAYTRVIADRHDGRVSATPRMSGYSTIIALDGPCEGLYPLLGQVDENGVPRVEVKLFELVHPDLPGGFGPNLAAEPTDQRPHQYRRVGFNDEHKLWECAYISPRP